MHPPQMASWNLALRLGLEIAAFVGIGMVSSSVASGWIRWVVVALAVLATVSAWGIFNVLDDPSRSGRAPVEVPGWARLVLELVILGGAAVALIMAGRLSFGWVLGGLVLVHYLFSWSRVRWLLEQ
jgi:hypothetical protein